MSRVQALINLGYNGPVAEEGGVLTFQDPSIPRPSDEEIEAEAARLEKERADTQYQRERFRQYPTTRQLADAIYWMQKGDNSKMEEYIAACDAVKEQFPKPQ